VASSAHHGRNRAGTWDAARAAASFPACQPDKEPPLWNPQSKVIYWWTASAAPGDRLRCMAYNAHVAPLRPQMHWGSLGFRAVKKVSVQSPLDAMNPCRENGSRPGAIRS